MRRILFRNTVVNALSTAWGLAFALILPPFVIRTLGKEQYGVWVLVMSFSVITGYLSVLDLGLQTAVVKFVAQHAARQEHERLNQVVGNALTAYLILGTVGCLALVIFATFFLHVFQIPAEFVAVTRLLFYILAIQVFFEFPGLAFSGILEGMQRFDIQRFLDMGRLLIYAALVFWLLARGHGLIILTVLTAASMIGRVLASAVLAKRVVPALRFRLRFEGSTLREILNFTGKILVIRVNAVIYNQMDKAIIGVMLISTLLTDYDIANKIHQLVLTTPALISVLVMPTASDLQAREHGPGLRELFIKATKYTVALCLPTTIVVMVLAGPIIHYWIGPEYVYNAGITRLFLVYLLFTALTPVGVNMMIGMDRFAPLLPALVITTAINLLVSVLLARVVGVAGVILGTLVGNVLVWYPYMRHFLRTLAISWPEFFRRIILRTYPQAGILAILMLLAISLRSPSSLFEVVVTGALGLGFYALLFYLFGLEPAERALFTDVIRHQVRGHAS